MSDWTLFSNHGHVLVCLARDNEVRLRSVADDVGITERAVQKIVRELQQAGFVAISKHGRCNRYDINARKTLRHALEAKCTVGRLLQLFTATEKRGGKATTDKHAKTDSTATAPPQDRVTMTPEPESPQPAKRQGEPERTKKKRSASKEETADPKALGDTRQQGSLF